MGVTVGEDVDNRATWLRPWWKELPVRWGHAWHAMCSYLAMFPPALPRYFVEQCSRPGDTVFDPFAGRGTTALEACVAGRIGIGTDANPLAALLTRAKVDPPDLADAKACVDDLRSLYRRSDVTASAPPEIEMLFDGRRTLPQLLFIREMLQPTDRIDRFLLATLTGVLHGNHAKDPKDSGTLSISMPNTFAMSPNYIAKYIREHHLQKYPFDVFDALDRRLDRLARSPAPAARGRARQLDVRLIDYWLKHESVDLIVTSPPYLKVVRYGKYNWIRLWLLNEAVEEVDSRLRVEATDNRLRLSDQLRLPAYTKFMIDVMARCERLLRPGGVAVFVIGDVDTPSGESTNLARHVWDHARAATGLKLVDIVDDPITLGGKVTRIWGSRRGEATKIDRILVVKKPGGRRYRARPPALVVESLKADARPASA